MKINLMDTGTLIGDSDSRLITVSAWMISIQGSKALIAKACGRDGKMNGHVSTLSSAEIRADYIVAPNEGGARSTQ